MNSTLKTKINGETHHKPRYKKFPALMAIGTIDQPDTENETIFNTLVNRNAINFHSPGYAVDVFYPDQNIEISRNRINSLLLQLLGVHE